MRKRSKYRPKGVRLDVVNYVLSGVKPISSHEAAITLRVKNHAAMTALTKGEATRNDIEILIAAFNVTEAMTCVSPKLGADWREEIGRAQDALFAVATRGVKNGNRFILTGPEMTALNLGMDVHDAQLDTASVLELERATNIVRERIRNKQTRRIE